MSFDESVAIYEKITDEAESDFVNMLMAQNKDINKTEVCQKLVKFFYVGIGWPLLLYSPALYFNLNIAHIITTLK